MSDEIIVRDLGCLEYEPVWLAMQKFTRERDHETSDEFWCVEHPAVYTQGVSGKAEHILDAHGIPVVHVNRGGQVTYHGPGQIVLYVMIDIRRRKLGIRQLVSYLEEAVIELLGSYGHNAEARADAPGVYVAGRKVSAVGLRISNGASYHGLSLNVAMDLQPFAWINPCGYRDLEVTQLRDLGVTAPIDEIKEKLQTILAINMGYTTVSFKRGFESI